jgi:hypothetical protein
VKHGRLDLQAISQFYAASYELDGHPLNEYFFKNAMNKWLKADRTARVSQQPAASQASQQPAGGQAIQSAEQLDKVWSAFASACPPFCL